MNGYDILNNKIMTDHCADVEKMRLEYESHTEWEIRRRVLLAIRNEMPLNHLICLSHCFVNHDIYGNMYPPEVMKNLERMRSSISTCPELEEKERFSKPSAVPVKFVKEVNSKSCSHQLQRKIRSDFHPQFMKPEKQNQADTNKVNKQRLNSVMFVKAETHSKDDDLSQSLTSVSKRTVDNDLEIDSAKKQCVERINGKKNVEIEDKSTVEKVKEISHKPCVRDDDVLVDDRMTEKIKEMWLHISNKDKQRRKRVLRKLSTMAEICGMEYRIVFDAVPSGFHCQFYLNDVQVAFGHAPTKGCAKDMAITNALILLDFPHFKVIQFASSGKKKLRVSPVPFEKQCENAAESWILFNNQFNRKILKKMHIFMSGHQEGLQAGKEASVLQNCSNFIKKELSFQFCPDGKGYICQVSVGTPFLLQHWGIDEVSAHASACAEAVKFICQKSCGVKVRKFAQGKSEKKEDPVIPDNNVGNILLKKMGWTGGGVGKEGNKGIAEPIKVHQVINRGGLGLTVATSRKMKKKMAREKKNMQGGKPDFVGGLGLNVTTSRKMKKKMARERKNMQGGKPNFV